MQILDCLTLWYLTQSCPSVAQHRSPSSCSISCRESATIYQHVNYKAITFWKKNLSSFKFAIRQWHLKRHKRFFGLSICSYRVGTSYQLMNFLAITERRFRRAHSSKWFKYKTLNKNLHRKILIRSEVIDKSSRFSTYTSVGLKLVLKS